MSQPRLLPDGDLAALAAEHGTPLYVYDLGRVLAQVAELAAFDVVRYAQKANAFPALLARLAATRSPAKIRCHSGRFSRSTTCTDPSKCVRPKSMTDQVLPTWRAPRTISGFRREWLFQAASLSVMRRYM